MQFDTAVNDWHTCSNTARINASNPCSEYMFLDDSACNLASLNLMQFAAPRRQFDVESFRHAVDVVLIAKEMMVGYSRYPSEDRREQPCLSAAGPGLCQPRRSADGLWPAL